MANFDEDDNLGWGDEDTSESWESEDSSDGWGDENNTSGGWGNEETAEGWGNTDSGWGNENGQMNPQDSQMNFQEQNAQPSGGSNIKVVAIIIAITVGALLLVYGVTQLRSRGSRQNTQTQQTTQVQAEVVQTTEATTEAPVTEEVTEATTVEQQVAEATTTEQQVTEQQVTEQPTTEAQVQQPVNITQPTVVDENSLNYGEQELSVSGVVTNKQLLDIGTNQYVYCVEITSVLGNNSVVFEYYCTKNTFDSLFLNDILVVNYKQVAEDKFVICSALK